MRRPFLDEADPAFSGEAAEARRGGWPVDRFLQLAAVEAVHLRGHRGSREGLPLGQRCEQPGDQLVRPQKLDASRRRERIRLRRWRGLGAGGDRGRALRRRLERLVVLPDRLDLGGVDGALLAVERLPLGVMGTSRRLRRSLATIALHCAACWRTRR